MRISDRRPSPAPSSSRPRACARPQKPSASATPPARKAPATVGARLLAEAPESASAAEQAFFGRRAAETTPIPALDREQVHALRNTFRDRVIELDKLPTAEAVRRAPELLDLAEQVIASRGGRTTRLTMSDGREALAIEPDRRWYLGRLAKGLERRFDYQVVYCPENLISSRSVGAVAPASRCFLMPHDAVLSDGPADPIRPLDNVPHEVNHIYLDARTAAGDQPLFEGSAFALKGKQLVGDPSVYETYLSFQEASTFSVQASLVANRLRRFVRQGALRAGADSSTQFQVKDLTYRLGQLTSMGRDVAGKVSLNAAVARQLLQKDPSTLGLWRRKPDSPASVPLRQAAVMLPESTVTVPILDPKLVTLFDEAEAGDAGARAALLEAVSQNLEQIREAALKESAALGLAHKALEGLGFEMPTSAQLHDALAYTKVARRGVMAAEASFAKAHAG